MIIRSHQIRSLDEKLHEEAIMIERAVPNNQSSVVLAQIIPFRPYKHTEMSQEDINLVRDYLQRPDAYIAPIRTEFDISIGYDINKVVGLLPGRHENQCSFLEQQLPQGMGWEEMKPHMFNRRNLILAQMGGYLLRDDKNFYE